MVLQIVPEVLLDIKYNCVTAPEVRDEIYRQQRFKSRYPWRDEYKNRIKSIYFDSRSKEMKTLERTFKAIRNICEAGTINMRTNKYFDLSYGDQRIAAYVLTGDFVLVTTDKGLWDFLEQEFERNVISPLALINVFIKNGLLDWNDECRKVMIDWADNDEPPQPNEDIKSFQKLTGYRYEGR
ncbi:MAG: hypothetical protein MUP70_12665 [Candidatus Aminicenantes bacterium]|nr:hypothetical protein [Candidatus Aminicenantes bacterium]